MHAILIYLMNYKFYHLGHGSQNKGVNEEGGRYDHQGWCHRHGTNMMEWWRWQR